MKNWITEKIELNNEKAEIRRYLFKEFTCNSNDEVIDETEFDSKSNIVCKRIYRYFDSGDVKEFIEFDPLDNLLERHLHFQNGSTIVNKSIYEYAEDQKIIKTFQISDFGNADKVTLTDNAGEIIGYEVYIYDESNQMIKEIELDNLQNEISKFEKEYDSSGYLVNEKHYLNGQLNNTTHFKYDENGYLEAKTFNHHIENYQVIDKYNYDPAGNMIYNSCHQDNFLVFENKCSYDNDNRLIEEEFFEIDVWDKRIIRHEKLIHKEK